MKSTSTSLVAVLAAVAACAEAGGEVQGGELTDGGVLATNPPPFAPDTGAASSGPDCLEMGSTWTALYTGLFGPTDLPGSCTFRSNCHGSPDGAGAKAGAGVQCFDQKGCRQSFFDKGLVTPADFAAPEKSVLLSGLLRVRKPDGTTLGFMPQTPADYVFSDACVERIKTWIKDGAKDD